MKPENKLPVLDLISAEMKTVVNTLQPDLPPWPATGTIAEQRQYYTLERRFWNAGAPEMGIYEETKNKILVICFGDHTGRWTGSDDCCSCESGNGY